MLELNNNSETRIFNSFYSISGAANPEEDLKEEDFNSFLLNFHRSSKPGEDLKEEDFNSFLLNFNRSSKPGEDLKEDILVAFI